MADQDLVATDTGTGSEAVPQPFFGSWNARDIGVGQDKGFLNYFPQKPFTAIYYTNINYHATYEVDNG